MKIARSITAQLCIDFFFINANPALIFLIYMVPFFFLLGINKVSEIDVTLFRLQLGAIIPWLFFYSFRKKLTLNLQTKVIEIASKYFKSIEIITWLVYVGALGWLTYLADSQPLWNALTARPFSEIALSRIAFDLNKSGIHSIPVYITIIISNTLIPLFVLNSFIQKRKDAWTKLIMASFLVVSSLMKIAFLKVTLPVLFLFLIRRQLQQLVLIILFCLVFFGAIQFLSYGGLNKVFSPDVALANEVAVSSPNNTDINPDQQFLFGQSMAGLIFNRLTWIPYSTARTWIKYYEEFNLEKEQPIISNRTLAFILGKEYFPLERKIMNYQFNEPYSNFTGYANTAYVTDSWVKYGIIGYLFTITIVPLGFIFLYQNYSFEYRGLLLFSIVFFTSGGLINFMISNGAMLLTLVPFLKNGKVSTIIEHEC